MSKTEVSGKQLKDGSVELVDLAPEVSGVLSTLQSDVAALQTDVAAKADAGNLASVATSGSYNDLSDKPSIPSVVGLASETYVDTAVAGKADSASLASVATSGSYTDLINKPSLFSGDYGDLANKPTIPSVVGLASETYVDTAVAAVVNSAPAVLDTLNELSAALGNDENFATTVAGQIGDVASDVSALDVRVTAVEADVASIQGAATPNLSDLGEVAITTPSSGQVLKYDGLGWVNTADSTFSGVYADLTSKPTLFDGAYSSLTGAPSLFSGSYTDLTSKPTLFDGVYASLTGKPSLATVATSGSYNDLTNTPAAGASNLDGLSDVVITSAAKGHFIAHNGTNFVNTRTIEADVAATVPMTLKGAASQSGNFFQVQNSSSQILNKIGSDGSVSMYDSAGANGYTVSNSTGNEKHTLASQKAFQITQPGAYGTATTFSIGADDTVDEKGKWQIRYGTSGSSGAFVNFRPGYQDSNRFGGVGIMVPDDMYVKARLHIHNVPFPTQNNYGDFTGLLIQNYDNQTGSAFEIQSHTNVKQFAINKQGQVQAVSAATKALVVKGAASQTANLFEVQNSVGTALVAITSSGKIGVATTPIMMLDVQSAGEFTVGGGNFKAVAQFQKSSGNRPGVICGYDNSGNGAAIIGAAANTIGTPIAFWTYNNTAWGERVRIAESGYLGVNSTAPGAQLQVTASAAATKGIIVQGAASQTANLFEVQNSAGTALASISSAGTVHAARYTETVANAFNTSLAPSTGTLTVDTSLGNAVLGALSAAVTTWAFTNAPTDNSKVTTVTAVIAGNASYTYGDACSVNGSAVSGGIMWSGGSAPTATAGTDIITFIIVKDSAGTVKVFGSATTNFS